MPSTQQETISGEEKLNALFKVLTDYFNSQLYLNDQGKNQIEFLIPASVKIMIFITLLIFVLMMMCLCFAMVLFGCWWAKNKRTNDIEKALNLNSVNSEHVIPHSPKESEQHSKLPPSILERQVEISLSSSLPETLFDNSNAQNSSGGKTSKKPKVIRTINTQDIPKASVNSSISPVYLTYSSDTKIFRQKNLKENINKELAGSDMNTSDEEEKDSWV